VSTTQRKLAELIGIRQDVIELAGAVRRLHYASSDGRPTEKVGQTTASKSLYQIGKELRLVKTYMAAVTDDAKRAAMRVSGIKATVFGTLSQTKNRLTTRRWESPNGFSSCLHTSYGSPSAAAARRGNRCKVVAPAV